MIHALKRLRHDVSGSTIIEFAILAPAICTLFLGILQVGTWMQSYNALRSVAADTGRYTAVQYQKVNNIANIDMATWARNRAINAYLFRSADISTDVTDATNQQIVGVTEKTLTLNYKYKSYLSVIGVSDANVTFKRPIFVKAS
jgi:Flp pilus assembly protein TadG